jgi:hypothetical protein
MKKLFKIKKAQSMTEFVIIAPVLLLLFVGIYQFALLMVSQIKIAMVEREVMRFLTDEADKDGDYVKFGKEMAGKIGLDPDKVSIHDGDSGYTGQDPTDKMSIKGISVLSKLKGLTFVTEYDQDLLPLFAKITGINAIKLQTKLTSAAGGSFVFDMNGLGNAMGKIFGQGRDPESVYGQKESAWKEQNLPTPGVDTQQH